MKKRITNLYQSYLRGAEDHPIEEPSRLDRAAHKLGQGSLRRANEDNEQLDSQKRAEFEAALAKAQGPNKQVLLIMREAADIPHQIASEPLWSTTLVRADGSRELQWLTHLSSGADQDPTRPGKTPLVASLGNLRIDSNEWAHNGYNLPVDNLVIHSSAPLGENDEIGAPTTTIGINTRPYDPDNLKLDHKYEFTDGVKIKLDSDGNVAEFAMTSSSSSGYINRDPNQVTLNLVEFLEGVQAAAGDTVQAYQAITD